MSGTRALGLDNASGGDPDYNGEITDVCAPPLGGGGRGAARSFHLARLGGEFLAAGFGFGVSAGDHAENLGSVAPEAKAECWSRTMTRAEHARNPRARLAPLAPA